MYESDEWYLQYEISKKTTKPARPSAPVNQLNNTEDHWDLDASASDNEAYELEIGQSHLD